MPIAKESGSNFTPAPEGTFVARCFGVIALGTQSSPMFAPAFKVMLMWELPTETITIEKELTPMVVSKEYTLSLSKKANLRRDLESWRGREFTAQELEGFAVEKVIGQPCMISISHRTSSNGKTYAAINAVTKLLKGVDAGGEFHKRVHYEIEHGKNAVFQSLPEWIQKKILACEEIANPEVDAEEAPKAVAPHSTEEDSDIPF